MKDKNEISVIKRNGRKEPFAIRKIELAVEKAAERSGECVDFYVIPEITGSEITVQEIHHLILDSLKEQGLELTADVYARFIGYKENFVEDMEKMWTRYQEIATTVDTENANADATLISTKQSLMCGFLAKTLFRNNFLSAEEVEAIDEGYIYIHDLGDMLFHSFNCCLFDMESVLNGGFTMSGLKYKEPKNILSALQLIGDVTLAATSQNFGGFTIPEIDKVLVKYYRLSLKLYREQALEYKVPEEEVERFAEERTYHDLRQGLQSLNMKLNSIPSARGSFAFTTLTFGNLDCEETRKEQIIIVKALLKQRMEDSPILFPKLVFLFSWQQWAELPEYDDLYDACIECSCNSLYPDYLAFDTKGQVSDLYRSTGKVVSPMGCRAFLADYKGEDGESFFCGRANVGATSLNLPMIWMKAKEENLDFYETLHYYLGVMRNFWIKRYDRMRKVKASTNPLCYMEGGLRGGHLQADEEIASLVKPMTCGFGITALTELNVLMQGCHIHEAPVGEAAINAVVSYIADYVAKAKVEDGNLYALYGTPSESLCGTQVRQFRAKYGVIEHVSDREYFSNSFHAHVSAEISPFQKQDIEERNYHIINGGHITYGRFDVSKPNIVKGVVLRAMEKGLYYGVNAHLSFCDDCGWTSKEGVEVCGHCGSNAIFEVARVSGYLGFSKVKNGSRFNDAKLAEVRDRKSM